MGTLYLKDGLYIEAGANSTFDIMAMPRLNFIINHNASYGSIMC